MKKNSNFLLFDLVAGQKHHYLSSLQFTDWSFIEPQEVDEIVQLCAHAYLIKSTHAVREQCEIKI
jgi:hypothetical protein